MRLMLCTLTILVTALAGLSSRPAAACGIPEQWLTDAVSEDDERSRTARASLRELGPWAIDALATRYAGDLAAYEARLEQAGLGPRNPLWSRVTAAIDAVGAQRDNHASRLYWYTDIEQAQRAAQAQGQPILSLRLLGRLDEDLSCANSRFFRTALYANQEISKILREQFVLHWESVRPVPRITIDFGDGRKMSRTITGNSLHYVLDGEGRALDALPGLHGPGAFRRWLESMHGLHAELAQSPPDSMWIVLSQHHDQALMRIEADWARDATDAGVRFQAKPRVQQKGGFVGAELAAMQAIMKSAVEMPLLAAMRMVGAQLELAMTDGTWDAIAQAHLADARLDASSRRLMAAKTTVTPVMIDRFQRSLALDTVHNEYRLHRRIHEWFLTARIGDSTWIPAFALAGPRVAVDDRITTAQGVHALTEQIYARLFLTPFEDPWLGLLPPDTYAALDGNGVIRITHGPSSIIR